MNPTCHIRAGVAALAASVLVAGCGGLDAESRGRFTAARVISQETENGATPMFLATPGGGRVVAWVSAPDGGSDGSLHLSVTPRGASAPLPTVTVRDPLGPIEAHGEAPPQLAADSVGGISVLYTVGKEVPGERFPKSALRFIRSADSGRTWSSPVTVNDGDEFGSHNFHALTAAPDGSLLATWLDARKGKSGVWMSRSTDGGRTWDPNRPIYTDPTCPCCRTAVAVAGNGTIYVAWRAILPGDVRDVVVTRSEDEGRTWAPPVRTRADDWVYPGCPHAGPSLEVDARGDLHVAWWTGKEGEAGVYYARSDDGGRTFIAQPVATGDRARPAHVQLAVSGERVYVAWDDGLGDIPRVLLRRSTDGGRSFGPEALLSEPGVAASYPVLALYGDSVAVAWSQTTAAEHERKLASKVDMKDPDAVMPLPRVGQSEILMRTGAI
ncbi:MAG TPA: sialidase family protein [Gemmatimonadales bacterium]|nr:sialidase family protein [Gemmatimonadales bacterium]